MFSLKSAVTCTHAREQKQTLLCPFLLPWPAHTAFFPWREATRPQKSRVFFFCVCIILFLYFSIPRHRYRRAAFRLCGFWRQITHDSYMCVPRRNYTHICCCRARAGAPRLPPDSSGEFLMCTTLFKVLREGARAGRCRGGRAGACVCFVLLARQTFDRRLRTIPLPRRGEPVHHRPARSARHEYMPRYSCIFL